MTESTEDDAKIVLDAIVRDLGARLVIHEPLSGGVGTVTVHAPEKGLWRWGSGPMIVTTYGEGSPEQRTAKRAFMLTVDRMALGLMPAMQTPTPAPHDGPERRRG